MDLLQLSENMKIIHLLGSVLLLCGCGSFENADDPMISDILVIKENENVIFQIDDFKRGILSIIVIDFYTKDVLWDVNVNYHKSTKIIYGDMNQFPEDVFASQISPIGRKPTNIKGKDIIVRIEVQYDSFGSSNSKMLELIRRNGTH